MMRPRRAFPVLIVLIMVSWACSLGGAGDRTPADSAPSAGSVEVGATPSSTDLPLDEQFELEPPPPAGLMEAIESGVEAGDWTYAEALVSGLKLFTGEESASDLFSTPPAFLEGFGLVREAQRYAREGEDPAVRQELAERLDRLGPTSDRLLEYAEPATTGWRTPGLAAPSSAAGDCASLFGSYSTDGFPPGSGIKCLLYKEGGIAGQTVRVYWPIAYMTEPDYADAAYTGILQSWQAYAKLTPSGAAPQMNGVDLLFMILPDVEDPEVLAMVPSASTDDRCLIMVYLGAIQANEQEKSGQDDYGHFLQTIAHEMFHCFQVWNFPSQADDSWSVQDWWGEGTATYFSNVVYPDVNDEWGWIQQMAYHSSGTSVVEMSYDNFLFFQHFANERGNQALLDLILKLPVGAGVEAHAAALAKVTDIQALFHEFGRAYMDGGVVDSQGTPIPSTPPFIPGSHKIVVSETQIRLLDAAPFVLGRYAITFPMGWRYTIERKVAAGEGRDSARTDLGSAAWGDLPPNVDAGCGPTTLWVLVTTAAPPAPYSIEVTLTPKENLGCDDCLIGTWDINIDSFAEYSEAPFAEMPGFYTFDAAGGLWRYRFRVDGTMTGEFDFFYTYSLHQEGGDFGADIVTNGKIDIDGTGEGTYVSDGLSNLTFTLAKDSVALAEEIYINGQEIGAGPLGSMAGGYGYAAADNTVYSCDDEAGILLINTAPQANLPPIQYDRVSTDPNKP